MYQTLDKAKTAFSKLKNKDKFGVIHLKDKDGENWAVVPKKHMEGYEDLSQ